MVKFMTYVFISGHSLTIYVGATSQDSVTTSSTATENGVTYLMYNVYNGDYISISGTIYSGSLKMAHSRSSIEAQGKFTFVSILIYT